MMKQAEYTREILSFEEKISLSKLEVKKAEERTAELEYQKSRFVLDAFLLTLKNAQKVEASNDHTPL